MSASKFNLVRHGSTPVYEQICDHLKMRIAAGDFAPGERLPGVKTLARELGINHLPLHHALRKLEQERVVVTEWSRGTFVRATDSRRLQLALVLPSLNESCALISAGVHEVLAPSRSTLSLFHYNGNPALEREQLGRLRSEGYDGALVFPSLEPASLRPLARMMVDGYPVVFVDRGPAELPFWGTWADHFRGGYLAAEHLIARGCRRIACVTTPLGAVAGRRDGCLRALGDHRLPVDYNLIRNAPRSEGLVGKLIDDWLARPDRPDGIFFSNDVQALHGMRHLALRGVRVPGDIKVAGFDNLTISRLSTPALTTVAQDFAGIGRAAASLLLEQVQLPAAQRFQARHVVVPVSLVVRETA
jgi:DNA-binding LacI/PurR family transcriptional regulator